MNVSAKSAFCVHTKDDNYNYNVLTITLNHYFIATRAYNKQNVIVRYHVNGSLHRINFGKANIWTKCHKMFKGHINLPPNSLQMENLKNSFVV